jgi:immune inhibitor A
MKGKAIKTAMAVALGLSTFALGVLSPTQKVAAETALKEVTAPTLGVTADLGIANDERLIEMLKKQGEIPKNATQAQADKALQEYLKGKNKVGSAKDKLPKPIEKLEGSNEPGNQSLKNGNGNKLGQAKKNKVDSVIISKARLKKKKQICFMRIIHLSTSRK